MPELGLLVGTFALLVLGLLPERSLGRSRGFAGAAALLVWTGSLTAFVFAEDSYVDDGSSRWSNRGSSEHEAFVVVAATALLVAALLVVIAARGTKPAVVRAALLAAGAASLAAAYAVVVSFAAN